MNDVLQRVSGESQPVPLWRTASTEDLDNIKEKEFPLLYSFRLNLKVISLGSVIIIITLRLVHNQTARKKLKKRAQFCDVCIRSKELNLGPGSNFKLHTNGHLCRMNTSIRRTTGVGYCAPFFSHFNVSKLSLSRTPL